MSVSLFDSDEVRIAGRTIRARLGSEPPAAGIILGSGLGEFARRITDQVAIPFADIPGFPQPTVIGHQGAVIAGTVAGRRVICLAGRLHMYEGHSAQLVGFPVRVLRELGAPILFVSNAAGGIRRTFRPGDLMLIRDHLNLMFRNPLRGSRERVDERALDTSGPYDLSLANQLRDHALAIGLSLQEGVYAGLLGPTYETPAEVRMLSALGADAVGMSTVPEVIVARSLGMRVAGVTCITNLATGLTPFALSHTDVSETATRVAKQFEALVERFVGALA